MKQKPTNPNKRKLDPLFSIPAGAEDLFVYSRDYGDGTTLFDPNVDDLTGGDDLLDDDPNDDDSDTGLGVPENFSIVQQIVGRASGQLVIDVVVEIENVPNATDYEIHVVRL